MAGEEFQAQRARQRDHGRLLASGWPFEERKKTGLLVTYFKPMNNRKQLSYILYKT
jgi:hypothetical protein